MKDPNPLAVNILKLQRYNFKFFSLEEAVFFEYLVVKARAFKFNQFYHSTATIQKETGIRRNKLETIVNKFGELGILIVEIKGFPKVKHFTVNFEKVEFFLPKIYQFVENNKLNAENSKLLADFYKPFVESYKQKNIKKEYLKEYLKEKEGGSDWDPLFLIFNDYLQDLKTKKNLAPAQLKYNIQDAARAFSNYDRDTFFSALKKYFNDPGIQTKKVSDFLKVEPLNESKNIFIEYCLNRESLYTDSFIEALNRWYSERRNSRSKEKHKYKETRLVVNQSIKSQVSALLKVRTEIEIENAFKAYCDRVLNGEIQVRKTLPYFLSRNNLGEYSVIDENLDYYNLKYSITYN